MLGVYDYAGPTLGSRYRRRSCGLPLLSTGSRISFSKLNTRPTDASVYASPAAITSVRVRVQELSDLLGLMGRERINNDMNLLLRRGLGDDLQQKINELLTGVPLRCLAEHLPRLLPRRSSLCSFV